IYVGTDLGVWRSTDAAADWNAESGLPTVPVLDLVIQPVSRRVFAFTHGRGAFVLSSCVDDNDCDDGDPCTTDHCTADSGCVHAGCDDGDLCTTDVCTPSGCTHPRNSCAHGGACTTASSDGSHGCSHAKRSRDH